MKCIAVAAIAAMAHLGSAGASLAQLPATQWLERCVSVVDNTEDVKSGSSDTRPEPMSHAASVANYSFDGAILFPPSFIGPVAVLDVTGTSGGGDEISGASSFVEVTINFWFRVVQTAPPPLPIAEVLVQIQASADVTATGTSGCSGQASATFSIGPEQTPDVDEVAFADLSTPFASFDLLTVERFAASEIVPGRMFAKAEIRATPPTGGTGTASALIAPVIAIVDAAIPGTTASYRDHYRIEFGEGFDALDPTPVTSTSWSTLKSLYGK